MKAAAEISVMLTTSVVFLVAVTFTDVESMLIFPCHKDLISCFPSINANQTCHNKISCIDLTSEDPACEPQPINNLYITCSGLQVFVKTNPTIFGMVGIGISLIGLLFYPLTNLGLRVTSTYQDVLLLRWMQQLPAFHNLKLSIKSFKLHMVEKTDGGADVYANKFLLVTDLIIQSIGSILLGLSQLISSIYREKGILKVDAGAAAGIGLLSAANILMIWISFGFTWVGLVLSSQRNFSNDTRFRESSILKYIQEALYDPTTFNISRDNEEHIQRTVESNLLAIAYMYYKIRSLKFYQLKKFDTRITDVKAFELAMLDEIQKLPSTHELQIIRTQTKFVELTNFPLQMQKVL